MRSLCGFRIARTAAVRVIAIAALLGVIGRATEARADNVTELIRQLESDDSDKVRLSAAINLTKLGDARAIPSLTKALASDPDKTVRGAAAVGLGKLVTGKTDGDVKKDAIAALTQAKDSDPSNFVRVESEKALGAIGVATPPPSGGIYVNIGPMAATTGNPAADTRLKAVMAKIANRMMTRSNMTITWPGGVPTQAALTAARTAGFFVDGTVKEVKVKETGSSMTVSCKISMLLATFPDKSVFGLLEGGGTVQASGAKTEVLLASEDCVSAVVEDLIAKKIVPTIKTKVTP